MLNSLETSIYSGVDPFGPGSHGPFGPMKPTVLKATGLFEDDDDMFGEEYSKKSAVQQKVTSLPNMTEIIQKQQQQQDTPLEEVPWIREGLLVACNNAELSSGLYMRKTGCIQRVVEDGWGAEIRMLESQDIILLDQDDCRPVVKRVVGEELLVVQGPYRGRLVRYKEASPDGRDAVVELREAGRDRIVSLPLGHLCSRAF